MVDKHTCEHLIYLWVEGLADYPAKLIFESLPHTLSAINNSRFAVHTLFGYELRRN